MYAQYQHFPFKHATSYKSYRHTVACWPHESLDSNITVASPSLLLRVKLKLSLIFISKPTGVLKFVGLLSGGAFDRIPFTKPIGNDAYLTEEISQYKEFVSYTSILKLIRVFSSIIRYI